MIILVDTNVVLDVMLRREPFIVDSAKVLAAVEMSQFRGLLCATTLTTIHYLARRQLGTQKSLDRISDLMTIFDVAPVNRAVIKRAIQRDMPDFEDAVLHEAAVLAGANCIVTRNVRDFKQANLLIFDPAQMAQDINNRNSDPSA